jgi:hypothetical protein
MVIDSEWRASFLRRRLARAARQELLDRKPQQLLVARGECERASANTTISEALSWIRSAKFEIPRRPYASGS